MLGKGNIKMAIAAIRSSRWRSLLTMLGIIIGVLSVITIVSLGEGIKQRVVGQINHSGADIVTIRPGRLVSRNKNGAISKVNVLSSLNLGSLSESDLQTIQNTAGVKEAVPFAYVTGIPHIDNREYDNGPIIATTDQAAEVLNQKLEYGNFFGQEDSEKNAAVIGKRVAEQLFQENVPIGKAFSVRDQSFIVHGIFEEFTTSPLSLNGDYNYAVFIPYESGKHIAGSQQQIYQILVKPTEPHNTAGTIQALTDSLTKAHNGQQDFTILTQAESLQVASGVLNYITSFITGIAAVSLFVGGIGIMNIMLLSVTERTREIGVRKAIGATDSQILGQFLIEAVILSLSGGLIGILLAGLANYLLRIFTTLTPVITLPIVLMAVLVAVLVGVIFGIMPALRAARKDPIEALRYE